jgi:hypothetical protein
LLRVVELDKPAGIWCTHCDTGKGCKIYAERPAECRQFHCGFLRSPDLKEEWRPSRCRIVLRSEFDTNRLIAQVDPERPGVWKREPFHSKLREWARNAVPLRRQVLVCIDKRTIVILPDRDVDLGIIGDDELIVTQETRGPSGLRLDALKMRRDDPRAAQVQSKRRDGASSNTDTMNPVGA